MNTITTVSTYPQVLQTFRGLPGPYGSIQIVAQNADALEFTLTQEWFRLNRDDAQEMIRVLSAWLAGPKEDTQVVDTHGAGSTVLVRDDGVGVPRVVLLDGERRTAEAAPPSRHYDVSRRPT